MGFEDLVHAADMALYGAKRAGRDARARQEHAAQVGWQPGLEGGALEGTPTDPRFAYIKHDR
jgi:hypothetical protein